MPFPNCKLISDWGIWEDETLSHTKIWCIPPKVQRQFLHPKAIPQIHTSMVDRPVDFE